MIARNEDHTNPRGKWKFDEDVARVFDDMLERSIPQYDLMRETVLRLALSYAQDGTDIVDLGSSRGGSLAPLVEMLGTRNRFIGVEASPPMLETLHSRFGGKIESGLVQILPLDLRHEYPKARASVTLAVLTVQFTPIEYRQQILRSVYESTVPGGILILVEKILGATARLDDLLVREYYAMKARSGYTEEEIARKRLSLEGVLVPVTAAWNEELLRGAGFTEIDCFWRWMNFAGWIAVRS